MPHTLWFRLLKCEDLLLCFVLCDNWISLSFLCVKTRQTWSWLTEKQCHCKLRVSLLARMHSPTHRHKRGGRDRRVRWQTWESDSLLKKVIQTHVAPIMSLSELSAALSGQPFSIKTEWLFSPSGGLYSPQHPLPSRYIFLYPLLLKKLLLSFSKSAVPLSCNKSQG